jgi:1,4-dihydroxy-2-naphthoate octaprenyltransferase
LKKSGFPPTIALTAAWVALISGGVAAVIGYAAGLLSGAALGVLAAGAFFGWMYSLKPLALGWRGLGELDNAVLGGILLPLYGYVVQSGKIEGWVILACVPFGALVFINLLATTWPDREADSLVGKRTLATRWSERRLRLTYWLGALSIFVALFLLYGWVLPPVVVWSSLIALPIVLWGALAYTHQHSPFPTVLAMVFMLGMQIAAWWSVCCLQNFT